ncbi:hypothetical protein SERLA73DRAFT_187492 [Serpula lacrymans var. lacrymans S7.3]|uniref:Uncharacterized protein n=2 Tax=Serpula lacrymans var. lacrymans TaxID=341189 RepID=F8Q9B6_SERL3|nr:uncharacterized protein SERLADRAFT_477097 [Serpula lacrymans var. lacrymans S7.9]EGN95171.1 hypothetical protein SERLA73DRAFT_187492 [Serpula lacrymans var. lacrymans S7.3]EGO20682.1 hypothetical protein SERLADRAFT_477097 [Serpula lacrymans var. lacrymans S7.9]
MMMCQARRARLGKEWYEVDPAGVSENERQLCVAPDDEQSQGGTALIGGGRDKHGCRRSDQMTERETDG